jgi:hypothetical protein
MAIARLQDRCSATVYTPGGTMKGTRCSKQAKVKEGRQLYCTVHAPSYKELKRKTKLEEVRHSTTVQQRVLDALGRYVEKRESLIKAILAMRAEDLPPKVRTSRALFLDAREHLKWARAQRGAR